MTEPAALPNLPEAISLEGVRVHNLKSIDVRIPLHQLTVLTGVSGSGKSSLAFDTLYAEGQRRYIESFSPYARQFLERLDKPDADRIDNLPPAVALRQNSVSPGKRSTIATATEIYDYLRLLFAKTGEFMDDKTGEPIRRHSPQTVAAWTDGIAGESKILIAFPLIAIASAIDIEATKSLDRFFDEILDRGFTRIVAEGRLLNLGRGERPTTLDDSAMVVVDRVASGKTAPERLLESLETAFTAGDGRCTLLIEGNTNVDQNVALIDGDAWLRLDFNRRLIEPSTGRELPDPTPALFSFHSPLGACPTCQGFGSIPAMSWEKLVPDRSKSLQEGAIVAWTTPAYVHELQELLDLADDYDLPVDIPFSELSPKHIELIYEGVPRRRFGGLKGFFRWLERKRYKIGVAAFLSRFRTFEPCPECKGRRLSHTALTVRIEGKNIADIHAMTVTEAATFFSTFGEAESSVDASVRRTILPEIASRLQTLDRLGLGYLTLDRRADTLSGGEARRVALTAAVGANLVNMLYVLDEPSTGLHPRDREKVRDVLADLRDGPNTVVVVEHDPVFINAADWLIDLGPGAGRDGGQVIFSGLPSRLGDATESTTAKWHAKNGTSTSSSSSQPTTTSSDQRLILSQCTRHNLKNLTVEFPLNRLCVVSGVSGSGKSTLVTETLYPALCRSLGKTVDIDDFDRSAAINGVEGLEDVVLIDQSPVGRTPRSNPATYLGAFDHIRAAFAELPESKLRRFTPGTFSFNTDKGGRCPHCLGAGVVTVDMQFLPDVEVTCPECQGRRFRRDVLEIKLRGQSIADVLEMTAAEAFVYFRGQTKIQRRLSPLKEVGLDYVPLGQPATTLSGGEAQRLKIAAFLGGGTGKRTLFLFDEPTVGLHAADVAKLLECFRRLIAVGHSIIVVEHRLEVMRAADWIIDLGPEAGHAGGHVIAAGPPAEIAKVPQSITGQFLAKRDASSS